MKPRSAALIAPCVLLVALAPLPGLAAGWEDLFPAGWSEGIAWEPQPVRSPVSPDEVSNLAPWVPASAAQQSGEVEVGPDRGAALWLSPLDVVRLRVAGADSAGVTPTMVRVPVAATPGAPRLRVHEAGIPARAGALYLAEPEGQGSVWLVTAPKRVTVRFERPTPLTVEMSDEAVRAALLAWIDGRRPMPALPFWAQLRDQLRRDEELASALLAGVPPGSPLRAAVLEWRKASALQGWETVQPLYLATARISRPHLDGTAVLLEGAQSPYVRPASSTRQWSFQIEGPGVVAIEARRVLAAGDQAPSSLELADEDGQTVTALLSSRAGFEDPEQPEAVPVLRKMRALASGEGVGSARELRLTLRPGVHTVTVRWSADTLLRPRFAHRRPYLAEALRMEESWHQYADRAAGRLEHDASARALVVRRLLRALGAGTSVDQGRPVDPAGLDGVLAALLRVQRLSDRTPDVAAVSAASQAVARADATAAPALAWHLRLEVARRLLALQRPAEARALLVDAPAFPVTGWGAAEAAALVEALPSGDPLRSRQIAALEFAWRQDPLAFDLRRRYRETWLEGSRWTTLSPEPAEDGNRLVAEQWLDVEPVEGQQSLAARSERGAHWPLSRQPTRVHVDAGPNAINVLHAYVVAPSAPKTAPVLHVDGLALPVLAASPLEALRVALPPGDHLLSFDAEPQAKVFISLTPAGKSAAPAELGHLRAAWPLEASRGLGFQVPDPQLPTPVRVGLRSEARKPVALWMHTDVGSPVLLELDPAQRASSHLKLGAKDADGPASASAVVMLPPLTHRVWFETPEGAPAVGVSFSVRRDLAQGPAEPVAAAVQPLPEDPAQQLWSLSRALTQAPEDPAPRLARAQLLWSLGEEGLARQDLAELIASPAALTPGQRQQVLTLCRQLDAADAPEVVRFAQPLTAPTPLEPAFGVLAAEAGRQAPVPLSEVAAASAALRAGHAPHQTGSPWVDEYVKAKALEASGAQEQAALALVRLFQQTRLPQVGLEALAALSRLQTSGASWTGPGAPISLALATELTGWAELPLIRRMLAAGQRSTRWDRLPDVEEKAGLLQALAQGKALRQDERVREALLAAPWGLEDTELLRPGSSTVLAIDGRKRRHVRAELLCGAVRSDPSVALQPCTFSARVDGREVSTTQALPGQTTSLTPELPDAGPHQVELMLVAQQAPALGLVRFLDVDASGSPVTRQQPLTLMRARPGAPVVVTILGPAVVRLTGRPLGSASEHRAVRVTVVPIGEASGGSGQGPVPQTLELSSAPDPEVTGSPVAVGQGSQRVLVLPEAGPQQLRLELAEGEAGVQIDLAQGRPGTLVPAAGWHLSSSAVEPLPWPALPERLSLLPEGYVAQRVGTVGTLSAELGYRQEDVGEGELLGRPLTTGIEARLDYRRALKPNSLWVLVEPRFRFPIGSSPVSALGASVYARELPLGLRANLTGSVAGQTIASNFRWSARVRAALSRWIGLVPDLALVPGLSGTIETFQGGTQVAPQLYDQSVYWRYGEERPHRVTPWTSLRWQPFQDQLGELTLAATGNTDRPALDHADAQLRWASFLSAPLPRVRVDLMYELSYRAQDPWRDQAYLRHGLRLAVDWSLWVGRQNRVVVFAEDRALFSAPFGIQNTTSVGLRFDWTDGRGLRDELPLAGEFEQLLDPQRSLE